MATAPCGLATRPACAAAAEQPRRPTSANPHPLEASYELLRTDISSTYGRREQSCTGGAAAPYLSTSPHFTASRLSRMDSGSGLKPEEDKSPEGRAARKRRLPRWLCSWRGCFCGAGASRDGSIELQQRRGGGSVSQVGQRCLMLRRPNASPLYRPVSTAGLTCATSATCSGDSHLGPLPTRLIQTLDRPPSASCANAPALTSPPTYAGAATTTTAPGSSMGSQHRPRSTLSQLTPLPPVTFANRSAPAGSCSASHQSNSVGNSVRASGLPRVISVANTAASGGGGASGSHPLGVSRASSLASYTSGVTTTSRPSRWGLLANILSAGLRSFSQQLASVIEPNTGSLTSEAVLDLTRRASRLDMLRAVGQVHELSLVGSGSAGLVYRGRSAEGGKVVCVKYLVARGTDGMAAPATEGLLSRVLAHPNIVVTFSWHVTRVTTDNFLDLHEALAAMAAREARGAGKQARRGHATAVGKGRRGGGGGGKVRHVPIAGGAVASSSSLPLPKIGSSLGACFAAGMGTSSRGFGGGGAAVAGVGGTTGFGVEVCSERSKSPEPLSAGFTTAVLDLVCSSSTAPSGINRYRTAAAAAAVPPPPTTALASPLASPAIPVLDSSRFSTSSSPRGGQQLHVPPPEPVPPLLPVCASPQLGCARAGRQGPFVGLEQQQAQQPGPRKSVGAACEGSWTIRRANTGDDVANDIVRQSEACDLAHSMTAGAGGGAAEGNAAAGGMFSRDSLSSHWLVSPSTSNHQPNIAGGGGLYGSRSTGGGGLFGDNSMYGTFQLGAAVFPCSPSTSAAAPTAPSPPMPAVATSPVSVPGASCRGRATLARAGSRLQVATTSIRQPSIPEDMQALGIADYYLPVCVAPAQPPLAALQAPAPPAATVATNDEARRLMYGIPACGDAGATCRSCAPGATALAAATAAAAAVAPTAVAESVGGACTHSGGASAGIESPFALVAGILPPPSPCSPCSPLSPQRCGSFSKAPRGLLAAAIAAHANPHTSHCPHPASPGPFGSGARAMPAYAGVNVASSAAAITLHERPASASVSAAFSRMTFSSKRLSGVTFGPNFAHCSAPTPCDAVPNSSANVGGGASAATARSMPPPGVIVGGPGAGSGSASVAATGSGSGGRAAPSAAASTIAAMEAEAVKQDALERGWKTLQEIMQRLNARPGDFLTRIVMEDADQGSLLSAVRNGCFQSGAPDSQLRTVLLTALDIARGMAFLHKSNVIHGDLKPSNVLLCSDAADPRGFVAKVSDFGLSRIIARGQDSLRNPEPFPAGTVSYMAPETVSGCSCKASDVWSYAVLVWQLLTGELAPWPGLRNVQIMMGVLQGDLRLSMPQGAYPPLARLIESCLTHDFQQRPSFDDIVAKLQEMLHNLAHAPAAQPTPAAATALQNHHEPRETGPASTTTTTTTIASVVLVNTAAAATATPSGSPAIASLRPTRGGAGAAHVDRNNDLASEGDPPDRPMGQSPFATVTTMLAPTPSPAPASAAVPIAVDTAAYVLPLPVASEAPTVNLLDAPIAAAVAASFRTRCPPTGSVEPRSTTSKPALTVNACTAVFPRAPSAAAAAASAPASTADMQDQHQQQRQRQRIANPTVPTTCRSPTNPFMEASCLRAFDRNLLLSGVAAMPQSSLTGTDASLTTAAASSNQLSNVSSSWANTTEREHRGGGWNHAWHSSAWQLPTVPASGAGSGIGGGGSSHIYSRPSMTASMGVSLGGAGVMQEFLYRQRISAGSVPTDMSTLVSDCHLSRAPRSPFAVPEPPPCCPVAVGGGGYSGGCASNICCYNGGHANNDDGNPGTAANCSNADGVVDVGGHARARAPLGAPDSHMRAATCPSTLAIVGSTLSSALMTCGGGSDMSHMILPIVHEEPFHVTTTSSGYQTAMTHGSPTQTLSGSRHVLTGNAGDRRHPESFLLTGSGYDNRRQHESSVLGSSPRIGSGGGGASCGGGGSFGGGGGSTIGSSVGEAALPVMLQAGLIVLGAREITAGRSSKSICSRSVSQALRAGAAGTGSEGLSHLEDGSQGQRGREEFSPAANSRSSTGTGIALMMPSGGFAESRRSCRSLVSGPLGCQEGGHSGALSGALVLRKSCSLGRGGRS